MIHGTPSTLASPRPPTQTTPNLQTRRAEEHDSAFSVKQVLYRYTAYEDYASFAKVPHQIIHTYMNLEGPVNTLGMRFGM
jgi:hypothetical protein